ncbi:MAG: hypothetical protein SGJ04_04605 [Bacteroidota bacterium]|nr:hypothetical protein [Bacteroidota bacterium]
MSIKKINSKIEELTILAKSIELASGQNKTISLVALEQISVEIFSLIKVLQTELSINNSDEPISHTNKVEIEENFEVKRNKNSKEDRLKKLAGITDLISKAPKVNNEISTEPAKPELIVNQKVAEPEVLIDLIPEELSPNPTVEQPYYSPSKTEPLPSFEMPETHSRNEPEVANSIHEKFAKKTEEASNPFTKTSQNQVNDLNRKLSESSIKEMKTAININQKLRFIKELFKGDNKAFSNAVTFIDNSKIQAEANFFAEKLSEKYEWNNHKESAQEFLHLIKRRFNNQ